MLNLQRNLRKLNLVIIVGLLSLLLINNNTIYAYWNSVETSPTFDSSTIIIGEWEIDVPTWDSTWNLNLWTEDQLNTYIPHNTIFSYNGILYIVNPNTEYNPRYNGLPGQSGNNWATIAIELEWKPNTNYRNNSVVTRYGKYYITNTNYNNNWFIDDPAVNRNEWLEIEPIAETNFGFLLDTTLRDYSNPDFNFIVYK